MSHIKNDQRKLIARIRRIKGQLDALDTAVDNNGDHLEIIQLAASARGAMDGLIRLLIEGHVFEHVLPPEDKCTEEQHQAAHVLVEVLRTYLK